MTLNGEMALILRYFTEFGSIRGALRKSGWQSHNYGKFTITIIIIYLLHQKVATKCKHITQPMSSSKRLQRNRAMKQFYQLYIILAYVNTFYIPLVFALLPDKTQSTYETFLHYLVTQCEVTGLQCTPQRILVDFENCGYECSRS